VRPIDFADTSNLLDVILPTVMGLRRGGAEMCPRISSSRGIYNPFVLSANNVAMMPNLDATRQANEGLWHLLEPPHLIEPHLAGPCDPLVSLVFAQ